MKTEQIIRILERSKMLDYVLKGKDKTIKGLKEELSVAKNKILDLENKMAVFSDPY